MPPEVGKAAAKSLETRETDELAWTLGDLGGAPIVNVGIEVTAQEKASGALYLDYLDWSGVPDANFRDLGNHRRC